MGLKYILLYSNLKGLAWVATFLDLHKEPPTNVAVNSNI